MGWGHESLVFLPLRVAAHHDSTLVCGCWGGVCGVGTRVASVRPEPLITPVYVN